MMRNQMNKQISLDKTYDGVPMRKNHTNKRISLDRT